jgi:hypothetical protein
MIIARMIETGPTPKLMARERNNVNREVMRDLGNYWHDNFRAKHFTREGAFEYGYALRSRGYMIRKAKVKGHQDPLVWSGLSRELSRIKDIRPTATSALSKVRVILHTPALNFIPKGGNINLRDEMTRVSEREITTLGEVVLNSAAKRYNALTGSTTTRIG